MTAALVRSLRRLVRDRRGIAVTEFGILAPVFVVLLLGLMDLTYQAYTRAVLEGAIQKAGRDSGIEAAQSSVIDAKVTAAVKQVAKSAVLTFDRKSYSTFSNMKPERFTDTNGNGRRDPTECYDDINGNQRWDADPGKTGQGGASDVTLYTVTATYDRLFPLGKLLGWPDKETVSASTLLKNQPYASQAVPTVVNRCN